MSEYEIALAQAYLKASRQDAVAALVRSVRDLARMRAIASTGLAARAIQREHALSYPLISGQAGDARS